MATSQQQLAFAIRAVNEASKTLKDVEGDIGHVADAAEKGDSKLSKIGSSLGNVAKIAGGFIVAEGVMKLGGYLMDAVKGAAEDEAATMRLDQAIKNYTSTLDDSDQAHKEIMQDMDERIEKGQKLAFTDDQMRDSMQSLLAATGDYGEAAKRQAAAMDLARGAGIPLETATKMLGKMTEENVEVFKKMGITIGENATEADALAAVQAKFGGQAEAYANSTAGQFEQVKIRMAEVQEGIGGALLPIVAKLGTIFVEEVMPRIEKFANAVGPILGAIGSWIQANVFPILQRIGVIFQEEIMPRIEEFGVLAGEKFVEFQGYYEESIKPALANILAAFQAIVGWIVEHWPEISAVVMPVIEMIGTTISTVFSVATGLIDAVIKLLGGDFTGAWNALGGVVGAVWDGIVSNARSSINLVIGLMNGMIRAWNALEFSVSVPFGGPSFTVGTPNLPLIPQLGDGGVVMRPTLAVIGERGPEAVIPLSRAGGAGGLGIGATYNITVLDEDALLRTMVSLERSGRLQAGITAA